MIDVGEGPSKQSFAIHEKLATARSEFFKRAVKKPWAGSDRPNISMPEDNASVLKLYVILTYTETFTTRSRLAHDATE